MCTGTDTREFANFPGGAGAAPRSLLLLAHGPDYTIRQRVADPRSTQVDCELKLTQTAPRFAMLG